MDVESMEAPSVPVEKAVKMEEAGERIDEILLPLFPELDDSGIDSDSTELMASSARLIHERHCVFSDASSSDEGPMPMPWWHGVFNDRPNEDDDVVREAFENLHRQRLEANEPIVHRLPECHRSYCSLNVDADCHRSYCSLNVDADRSYCNLNVDADRSSPPLYEVELTASDEDDDASVLELVIPMQSSRYKRVPTASPKKAKPKTSKGKPKVFRTFYYSFICCMRK